MATIKKTTQVETVQPTVNITVNQSTLKSLAFWLKFTAILSFVIAAIITIATFGMGIIGSVLIAIPGYFLWKAGQSIQAQAESIGNYNDHTTEAMNQFRNYFMFNGILSIVSIILGLLGLLFFGVALGSIVRSPEFRDNMNRWEEGNYSWSMYDDSSSSSSISVSSSAAN